MQTSKRLQRNKSLFLAGDRNINSLDYSTNSIVKQIFNFSYQGGVAPFINQPTRVSRPIVLCITQILMNSFMDSEIMSGVIKTDTSDHFVIFCTIIANKKYHFNDLTTFKRDINKDTISSFKYLLKNVAWRDVWNNENASEACDSFLSKFTDLYDIAFPKKQVKIKIKNLMSPWITKGLVKSCKRK